MLCKNCFKDQVYTIKKTSTLNPKVKTVRTPDKIPYNPVKAVFGTLTYREASDRTYQIDNHTPELATSVMTDMNITNTGVTGNIHIIIISNILLVAMVLVVVLIIVVVVVILVIVVVGRSSSHVVPVRVFLKRLHVSLVSSSLQS